MNPSYFRIRLNQSAAMSRLALESHVLELEPPREIDLLDAVELACDEHGHWRGAALYVYERDGWTIFEDLTGRYSSLSATSWLRFAREADFVFAGYNDAIGYGELVVIEQGRVLRAFLHDDSNNGAANTDRGTLPGDSIEPLRTWVEVARFVDDDELAYSDRGWLWILTPLQ